MTHIKASPEIKWARDSYLEMSSEMERLKKALHYVRWRSELFEYVRHNRVP